MIFSLSSEYTNNGLNSSVCILILSSTPYDSKPFWICNIMGRMGSKTALNNIDLKQILKETETCLLLMSIHWVILGNPNTQSFYYTKLNVHIWTIYTPLKKLLARWARPGRTHDGSGNHAEKYLSILATNQHQTSSKMYH